MPTKKLMILQIRFIIKQKTGDRNCIEYKDGSCGCNKTREEIEADMKRANDYLASEEYRAEQEREAQLMELFMQNYDFERGDVIY